MTDRLRTLLVPILALALALATGCQSGGSSSAGEATNLDEGRRAHADGGLNQGAGGSWGEDGANAWGGSSGAGGVPGFGPASADAGAAGAPPGTNISLGGAQDFGYFRRLLADGIVPSSDAVDAAGFFAEHHTALPPPQCGERICLQAMLGVMSNLINGNNCTLLQLGLNSPIVANQDDRPPLDLVVVVDVSGSMSGGDKIGFVREGLTQMVNELNDEDRIAVIKYSSDASIEFPMSPLRGARNILRGVIDGLRPEGGTNIYAGLELGYRTAFADYDSGRQSRLILLSDGVATAGITDDETIFELSRRYNSEGMGLTTVGLGTDFNFRLMRGLAEQGDGNFYFVEHADAVEEVFTEELSYFTVPVAFDIELSLRPGTDYMLQRAYGSSFFEIIDNVGELSVPSVFLAHRVAHDDVGGGEGGTRRGGGSALLVELMPLPDSNEHLMQTEVATIDITFREPGTDRIIEQRSEMIYPHPAAHLVAEGFFDNRVVEKSFVMLNIFVGIATACDRFHLERDPSGAIAMLQRLRAAVADYEDSANDGEGDVDMQFDMELLDDLIEVMQANNRMPEENPEIPEDPWPAD